MRRRLLLATLAGLLATTRASGGAGTSGGPFELREASRPISLRGVLHGITWVGHKGRVYQPLPTPRALTDLGELSPPAGAWDTALLHTSQLVLTEDDRSVRLPATTLEIVLEEPVRGGAPIHLQLNLSLGEEALRELGAETQLQGADARWPALQQALMDGAWLSLDR